MKKYGFKHTHKDLITKDKTEWKISYPADDNVKCKVSELLPKIEGASSSHARVSAWAELDRVLTHSMISRRNGKIKLKFKKVYNHAPRDWFKEDE